MTRLRRTLRTTAIGWFSSPLCDEERFKEVNRKAGAERLAGRLPTGKSNRRRTECWSKTCHGCGRVYLSALGIIAKNYRSDGLRGKYPDAYLCWFCRKGGQ